jgi:hypothetical protein
VGCKRRENVSQSEICNLQGAAFLGIWHEKYTISEGNLDAEIFRLRYENDITI